MSRGSPLIDPFPLDPVIGPGEGDEVDMGNPVATGLIHASTFFGPAPARQYVGPKSIGRIGSTKGIDAEVGPHLVRLLASQVNDLRHEPALSPSGAISIAIRCKINAANSAGTIVAQRDGASCYWQLYRNFSNFYWRIGANQQILASASPLVSGQWADIVVVHSGSQAQIFIGGVPGTVTSSSSLIAQSGGPISIGHRWNGYPAIGYHLTGLSVKHFYMWNRALTTPEIRSLHQKPYLFFVRSNRAPSITGSPGPGGGAEVDGTGGATVGGTGVVQAGWIYTATGGAQTDGAAVVTAQAGNSYTATGGATGGGLAGVQVGWDYLATGGAQSGGAAIVAAQSGNSYTATGGVQTGGVAGVQAGWSDTGSGGVSVAGVASLVAGWDYSGSGGAQAGGAANVESSSGNSYTADGGATSGGVADIAAGWSFVASGGAQSAGIGDIEAGWSYVGAGGATAGGTANAFSGNSSSHAGDGGAQTGGVAGVQGGWSAIGSGGASTGGTAVVESSSGAQYVASGGVQAGGMAILLFAAAVVMTGGAVAGGSAGVTSNVVVAGIFHGPTSILIKQPDPDDIVVRPPPVGGFS